MKKFFKSLLAKYMIIILTAISIVQIGYLMIALFFISIDHQSEKNSEYTTDKIEAKWHKDINSIGNSKNINNVFDEWKNEFPKSTMFWVDGNGILKEKVNLHSQLPVKWDSTYTAKFIKENYANDPFTVIAFLGKDKDTNQGFAVLQLPRKTFNPPIAKANERYGTILSLVMLCFIFVFIAISFLFFKSIRKRLLKLQEAMAFRGVDQLPLEIQQNKMKMDEIGQLEQTFNQMVIELRESKQRESQEEQLRRELIANLSHDLRTPLTKLSAQIYILEKEKLTQDGKNAVKAMDSTVVHIDHLIENLMSYTLLMASKYKFTPVQVDIVRFVRESIASWYLVFEKEGFTINVELYSLKDSNWFMDPVWFGRVLDNLFQNVLRHAKEGLFIEVKTVKTNEYDGIIIRDHGKGINNESTKKGAGIGLSIVDLMLQKMKLEWEIQSNMNGTTILIKKILQ
ncbi:sensor histidine kinase [Rummeliibacillus sp. TYF005]|uniref:HAMP domain-containing sensor histidine kinase n=1 Tax=Rummeliibacillus sp. TYF005 TaxID=2058214 RepID=UPI000F52AA16|nr:HAMP domain-containing sensor histidine kinase [Rummeliibacillus sp. TYF005]RPJ94972.1 sensor histidine kinase [Rummeliibacillus sp. TYF005]